LYIGKDGIFKIRVQLSDQIFHQTQIRILFMTIFNYN